MINNQDAEVDEYEADELEGVAGLDEKALAAVKMLGMNDLANAYSMGTMLSWGTSSDWLEQLSGGSMPSWAGIVDPKVSANVRFASKFTVVNPVTFGTIVRGFIDEEQSEGEKIAWKVANYSFTLIDIGVGIASFNPAVIVSIIGLGLTLIDDFIQWDSLWDSILNRDTHDYTERTLWLHRNTSFKFQDPANK